MSTEQPINSKRGEAFAAMTSAGQELASDLEARLDHLNAGDLRARHEIGTAIKQAISDQTTYGGQFVKQLGMYLGESTDALYKLRNFASFYSCAQVTEWSARKLSSGGRLKYNHLTAIMVVEPAVERLRLVELTFGQSLSVRALRHMISDTHQEKRKISKGGRKPKTILSGLEQLIHRAKALQKGFPIWNKIVFERIESADALAKQPIVLHRLVEAANLLEEITEQIQAARSRLGNAASHQRHLPEPCARPKEPGAHRNRSNRNRPNAA